MKLPEPNYYQWRDEADKVHHTPYYTDEQMREMYKQGVEAAYMTVLDLMPDRERCQILLMPYQAWCEALEQAEDAVKKLLEDV